MKSRKIIAAVAIAAATALALGACGSGSKDAAGSDTPPSTSPKNESPAASPSGSSTEPVSGAPSASPAESSVESPASSQADTAPAGDSYLLGNAKAGKLTIGIKFDQPGLAQKMPDGSFKGFDVDVATYVAKKLGVEPAGINFVEAKSAEREGKIERKEVDFIVATYSITDKRKESVNFAGPYFVAHQDLLVKADNTDITGPDALNGKILCSVTGSTPAEKVKAEYSKDAGLQEFGTYSECVQQLQAGVVEAVTTDDVILAGYAAEYPGEFKLVGKGFSDEKYGIGLLKGDTAGTQAINDALTAMVDDGSWAKALETNVGPSGYKIPAPPTIG